MFNRTIVLAAAAWAILLVIPPGARGHGFGRGYTATGPAARLAQPATHYFGGYDGVPLATSGVAPNWSHGARVAVTARGACCPGHSHQTAARVYRARRGGR